MIQGSKKINSESDYRATTLDSSSSLKDFSFDRKKYLKKYILNEIVEEKDTQASIMGRIVETLLLEPELFDFKFYMSACANSPTGLMNDFIEALYVINKIATDEEGNITRSFEEMSREAYIVSGFKIKYEAVIGKFIGSDSEIYYNEIRQVRANSLTVVTTNDVTNAEKIVEELKTNPITKDIVNLVSSNRYTVQNQLQIEGYSVGNHLFKSMMDKVVTDHQERTIQVLDLKCVWAVENFFEEYYLYRRAYIQGYLYYRAAQSLTTDPEKELYGYTVLPPKFIVCDSINYYSPLIYAMSEEDLADALLGFEYKGRTYPGVKEIIEDLQWSLQENIWNISRKNYLTNGIVSLRK